jgi:hypothetical protein
MRTGHCGIPLSIKGGTDHGREKAKKKVDEASEERGRTRKDRQ